MKHFHFFTTVLVALFILPCKVQSVTPVNNPSQFVTDAQKRTMLTSLESLDSDRFYLMNYTIDYRLDEVLQANATSMDSVNHLLEKLLYDVQPPKSQTLQFNTGCSAYAATLKDSAQFLMGRNYDFCHMEGETEAAATAMVLFTAPEGGKKSISFVDAYWLGFHKGFYADDTTDISRLMFAPYLFCDGMNEDGLAITVLHLDGSPTDQKEVGKPDIYTSVAMRAVLDQCSSVDSAVNLLKNYNMHMATLANGSLHFMLADSLGKYAVVEWSYADPMHVDTLTVPTVYTVLQSDTDRYVTNFYTDPRLKDCKFGGNSNHGRDRYNILRDTIKAYNHTLTEAQAQSLLQAVAQDPNPAKPTSHTQWSNVYNLSNRTVKCAILQEFGKWFEFTILGKVTPSGIEEVSVKKSENETQKVLKDGQILILHDGKAYNVLGVEVE